MLSAVMLGVKDIVSTAQGKRGRKFPAGKTQNL